MSSARRPDVIVVVLDGVRTFDVSAVWGDGPPTTPRLETLAAESLVFRQATSTSPWGLPAKASLLTGLMPSRHGANERTPTLAREAGPTLAELLAAEGYVTVALGGGDMSAESRLTRGYQRVVVSASSSATLRVDETKAPSTGAGLAARLGRLARRGRGQPQSKATPEQAARPNLGMQVEHALRDIPPDQPVHLLAHVGGARLPWRPSDAAALRFLDDATALTAARAVDQSPEAHLGGAAPKTQRDWLLLRALYRAAISEADAQLGHIVDALSAAGRLDAAVLAVVADHGHNIGDHGLLGEHHSLNDTVLRVPLVVRLPGAQQRGDRDDLAQLVDIVPTVCDVAGLPKPPTQGQSLTHPLPRTHAVAEYATPHPQLADVMRRHPQVDWSPYDRGLRSLRTAERKYVSASDGANELYDLVADPYEQDNLFGRHPDEVSLARALRRWEQAENAAPLSAVAADAAVSDRLRALGYIE